MDVSLLTTCLNFNTPPLAQVAPFSMQDSRVKRGNNIGYKTQQARLLADSGLHNSTFPSLVNCILTIPECRSDHHGSCTVLIKCLLSLVGAHQSIPACQSMRRAPIKVRPGSKDDRSACSAPAHQTCRCSYGVPKILLKGEHPSRPVLYLVMSQATCLLNHTITGCFKSKRQPFPASRANLFATKMPRYT